MGSTYAGEQDDDSRTSQKENGTELILPIPKESNLMDDLSPSLATTKSKEDKEEVASFSNEPGRLSVASRSDAPELTQRSPRVASNTLKVPKKPSRPQLQSTATTALSLTDIHTLSHSDGKKETYAHSARSTPSHKSFGIDRSRDGSEFDDSASVRSFVPGASANLDAESILGDVLIADQQSPAWKLFNEQVETRDHLDELPFDNSEPRADFNREFDEVEEINHDGTNEGKTVTKAHKANTC